MIIELFDSKGIRVAKAELPEFTIATPPRMVRRGATVYTKIENTLNHYAESGFLWAIEETDITWKR